MDNKKKDSDVIKGLECLHNRILRSKFAEEVTEAEIMALVDALDLINRQQAEIDRLKKKVEELSDVLSDTIRIRYAEAKSEAIKEFAERLKEKKKKSTMDSRIYTKEMIDNLIKEMVGENE